MTDKETIENKKVDFVKIDLTPATIILYCGLAMVGIVAVYYAMVIIGHILGFVFHSIWTFLFTGILLTLVGFLLMGAIDIKDGKN